MNNAAKIIIVAVLLIAVGSVIAIKKYNSNQQTTQRTAPEPAVVEAAKEAAPATADAVPHLLDLGAGKCVPCKMMMPVLEQLKQDYAGQLKVTFIDVWENPDAGNQYGIRMIPTQIFLDAQGKELYRHEGFLAREDILAKWQELGYSLTPPQAIKEGA